MILALPDVIRWDYQVMQGSLGGSVALSISKCLLLQSHDIDAA
jgi:hypothetical protein